MATMNLEKYFLAKKKNARIEILVYKSEDDGTTTIIVNTKRLHSFKERKISESNVIYGVDTLNCLRVLLDMLFSSGYANKNMMWQVPKEKWEVKGNVNID